MIFTHFYTINNLIQIVVVMNLETNTDTTRKLASIQRVDAVDPHPNADRLELISILGWQVCEVKGAVKVGDVVVYCEVDSLLPGSAEWLPTAVQERVQKQKDQTYYHVKTIKLRKEVTQGLIIPFTDVLLKCFPDIVKLNVEDDVTKLLGVQKYEKPSFSGDLQGGSSGTPFPSDLLDKTDETRVQSSPKRFQMLLGQPYYVTVKMDGTSGTFLLRPETGELLVCSRNQIREKPENEEELQKCAYHTIAEKYKIADILKEHPTIAVQGEICGPNIQDNWAALKDLQFFVFNVVDIPHRKKLPFGELKDWCAKVGLPMVPVVESGDNFHRESIKSVIAEAKGKYKNTKNQREGLVFRSQDQKVSFKAINNEFLIAKNKKEEKLQKQ